MFEIKKPFVMFIYGPPSSGKSSLADSLRKKLNDLNIVFKDERDIVKIFDNYTSLIDMIKSYRKSDLSLIISTTLPYESERLLNIENFGDDYIQVLLDCPSFECERRDVDGSYKKARFEKNSNTFIGTNGKFENSNLDRFLVNTEYLSIDQSTDIIISYLIYHGFVDTKK